MASQVGDFHNQMELGSGDFTTPAEFIYTQFGYRHDYLGEPSRRLLITFCRKTTLTRASRLVIIRQAHRKSTDETCQAHLPVSFKIQIAHRVQKLINFAPGVIAGKIVAILCGWLVFLYAISYVCFR